MDELVTTVSNETVLRSECRKIKNEYYKIGDVTIENSGDCYEVDGKFRRVCTGYIFYDHRSKQYQMKGHCIIVENGVVGIKDNNLVFGNYCKSINDDYKVFVIDKGIQYEVLDESIFEGSQYLESLKDGKYYHRSSIKSRYFTEIPHCDRGYKMGLRYDSRDITDSKTLLYDKYFDLPISPVVSKFTPYLKDLTFGLEFETTKGFVPERICSKLGLIPLRDGSIEGLEYVTIPLSGEKGVQALIESVKTLHKRTEFDDSCSLHLHLGNIPRTESFILALYKMVAVLQDDMYKMFPIYKKYNFGVKKKHYTKPFPLNETMFLLDKTITKENIKENFDVLYRYFSMGQSYASVGADLDNVISHPSDPRGTSKWNIKSRYHHMNFIPLLFGNKKTIEFRLHTPTYDVNKVLNYLYICSSLINFVKENETDILTNFTKYSNLNYTSMLFNSKLPESLLSELTNYIDSRKSYTYNCVKQGDIIANENNFKYHTPHTYSWETGEFRTSSNTHFDGWLKAKHNEMNAEVPQPIGIDMFR